MLDFLKKQDEKKENFWALLLEDSWVSSAIWQIEDGKVEVKATSPATRWDSTGDEASFTEAVDASLSVCSQNLPETEEEPTKTVFGVPSFWIEDGNIKEEYLEKLKKLCHELSLTPSGFVVLSEAIAHLIKTEEQSSLTGITLGISEGNFEFSIFNQGKLAGTTIVARSVSPEEDAIEGLSRLKGDLTSFPSRIILYNQKESELEEIKSSLSDADWDKLGEVKFIHTPKIEILESSKKILAVALAGGSEIGGVSGIETVESDLKSEEVINVEEPTGLTAEDLGFAIGEPPEEKKVNFALPALPKVPKFNFKMPSIPKFNLPSLNGGKPLIIGGVALGTFIVVGFLLWWFLPKASVTVFVSPKKLEENVSLEIENEIKTKTIDVEVSGEKTKSTTGTKTVGDKAKGQVKIQNGTAFPINLPTGTVLVSSSDLKFLTTKSASVSGALSPSSPGTINLDVEAGSIGSEYNLSKDEVFKVGNFPKAEVDATAIENLAGGSSRQISAVSDEDRKSLLKDLTNELTENAKTKLGEKISAEDYLIDSLLTSEADEENFSNKVGDEASSLKLSLTLTVKGTTVSKSELSSISKKALESKIPSGFTLRDDQLTYDFSENSDEEKLDVNIIANLLPNIDPIDVAKKITGKYPSLAESYLGSVAGFVRAEFRITPLLPGKLGTLPHLSKNIKVTISAER